MPLPHSPSGSPLGLTWLFRLERLQKALATNPEHPQSWRWRIEIKVLTFLVSRYGTSLRLDGHEHPNTGALIPDHLITTAKRRPLRSRERIRKSLRHFEAVSPHWPSGPGLNSFSPIASKPLRFWEVPLTLAYVAHVTRNWPLLRWLPVVWFLASKITYLLLALCLAAPYLWFLFTIISTIAGSPRP